MAVTQTSICNSALTKVGADMISVITEDSKAAKVLNAIWDLKRDELLAAHPWNFALKRTVLSPNATVPAFEYSKTYDLPNDCLKVVWVSEDFYSTAPEWSVEGRTIVCDYAKLEILYIQRNTDPSTWSPGFAEAFAWFLAYNIAYALTQSTEREASCMKSYREALSQARSSDGGEGVLRKLIADEWTTARL